MKVLIRNGKALLGASGVLAVKPYADRWGYCQAMAAHKTELYDWIYLCLLEGFSVVSRSINGVTYTVDGGNSGISHRAGVDPDQELHWLVIPLKQFNIAADAGATKSVVAFNAVFSVISDNPELLASLSPSFYKVEVASGKVDTLMMHFPYNTTALREKRREIKQILPTIDSYVTTKTTYSIANPPTTAAGRAAVALALNDWIMENVENSTGDQPYYWTHNAYNCFRSDTANRMEDCNGFAVGYQFLCLAYGINCIPVMGGCGVNETNGSSYPPDERTNHEWNMLSFELPIGDYSHDASKWYAADLRFNSRIIAQIRSGEARVVNVNGMVEDPYYFIFSDQVYADPQTDTLNTRFIVGGEEHDYRTRANYAIGYPVDVPAGVWTAPASAA